MEGRDAAHIEFLRDADLVIHDAQYTAAEYPAKSGWGHSTVEYAVDAAAAANAKQLAIFHHDPARTDDALDQIIAKARERAQNSGARLIVFGASEGDVIELRGSQFAAKFSPYLPSSLVKPLSEVSEGRVLVAGVSAQELEVLAAAAEADGLPSVSGASLDQLKQAVQGDQPSLIFLGDASPDLDPIAVCQSLRALQSDAAKDIPIIVVAEQSKVETAKGDAAGVTDWLTWPFSMQYARSRIRAWMMRSMLRWRKAALPEDEERRLEAVRRLGLLDTRAEERFDRHARIAAAALDAPIALITLVDRDRQWFKSHLGFDFSETPRDIGFCSHAVLADAPLVVADALQDDRFADNPAVVGDPHVRFYAGVPLHSSDGSCVGAFCIVDRKPRRLSPAQLRMLEDIAKLVEQELEQPAAART
jgi:DNA-binding response OmpR family regulator